MAAEARRHGRGRPLRALALVLGGWVTLRVALLWPDLPEPLRRLTPPLPRGIAAAAEALPAAISLPVRAARFQASAPPYRAIRVAAPTAVLPDPPPSQSPAPAGERPLAPGYVLALAGMVQYGAAEPAPPRASRWSGSGWAILRDGGAAGGVSTPQLGGSQAGVRLAYALDEGRRFAVAARVASALGTRQQEAAIGVEWRPTRLPVRLVAEQRIGIANARGGPSLGVVGGVSAAPMPFGFSLDGYAQAGAIARDGGEGYADGALRVARPVARGIDLGLGAWGAAQKGATRLDIGPSLGIAVPVGQRRLRLSLDWRQRVAGDARPMSGPALSIGTDF